MPYYSRKSIEDFKSNLANGGVRPTMFEVQIVFPTILGVGQGETQSRGDSGDVSDGAINIASAGDEGGASAGSPAELTQKSTFLASKVPALKRSVERFNWKCLLWQHNKDGTKVQMGSLKHRDARGNAILSQLELSEFDFNRSAIGVEEDVEEDSQKSLLIDQSLPLSFEI